MTKKYFALAGLLAASALVAAHFHLLALALVSLTGIVGVVLDGVYYLDPPGTPTSMTPPTHTAVRRISSVAVQVIFGDGDTTFSIVHNFSLSLAKLAKLQPWICWHWTIPGTAPGTISFIGVDGNTVSINKAAGAGTGGILTVVVQRPHTILRATHAA